MLSELAVINVTITESTKAAFGKEFPIVVNQCLLQMNNQISLLNQESIRLSADKLFEISRSLRVTTAQFGLDRASYAAREIETSSKNILFNNNPNILPIKSNNNSNQIKTKTSEQYLANIDELVNTLKEQIELAGPLLQEVAND